MKKDMKTWAIKLRGRSFYQPLDGVPFFFHTKNAASIVAERVGRIDNIKAEVIRVKVRIEEVL